MTDYNFKQRSRSRSPIRFDCYATEKFSRQVPGLRGRLVYTDHTNYTYIQNQTSTNRRQLRCTRFERGCKATASMMLHPENCPIILYKPHNHQPEFDVEIGEFLDKLRKKAAAEVTPARMIYEEVARKYPNATLQTSTEECLRLISRSRQRLSPPSPATLFEMAETILSPTWEMRLKYVLNDMNLVQFYQGPLEFIENGKTLFGGLIFTNLVYLQSNAQYFQSFKVMLIDGTFGVKLIEPAEIDQLVTVHILLDNISVPIVYALLNQRTERVYIRLMQYLRYELKINIVSWTNIEIVTDFEIALRNSIRRVVPEARLIGCLFYFSQAIVKFIQTHNFFQLVIENSNIASIIKLIMALPHLPPKRLDEMPEDFNIIGGFQAIQKLAKDMEVYNLIVEFFEYFERFWINVIEVNGFSVYEISGRTNNYIESFHSILKSKIGLGLPCWTFYEKLRGVENRVRKETQQMINGKIVRRSIIKNKKDSRIVENAILNVRNKKYDLMEFLRKISFYSYGYWNKQIPSDNLVSKLTPTVIDIRPHDPSKFLSEQNLQVGRGKGKDVKDEDALVRLEEVIVPHENNEEIIILGIENVM
ncbi:uncharacterized protein LOC126906952 isoform X2 [Daktulosphaira vitifoliae]|uniref:uncharacterized protein LOC126906952 isoform X2 n=1 Tax=Daktulosphaira vitifoliae TaxID=58002 RepID=UPI0021AA72DB|nr:uncharacterized protein LOC126906952 isoform X2 [Daktulosphaira vitifoliae]